MQIGDDLFAYAKNYHQANLGNGRECKVCAARAPHLASLDFNKTCGDAASYFGTASSIEVPYFKCSNCDFIFTDFFDAFSGELWSNEVYNADYYNFVDPDYESLRPMNNARFVTSLLEAHDRHAIGIDYGAGNGALCMKLRATGYTFDAYDPFGTTSIVPENRKKYNICTAFEVIEHSPAPEKFFEEILGLCSSSRLLIFVGTSVHSKDDIKNGLHHWWYAAPRNGHISLYSQKAFHILSSRFGLEYYQLSGTSHIFYLGYSRSSIIAKIYLSKFRTLVHKWINIFSKANGKVDDPFK